MEAKGVSRDVFSKRNKLDNITIIETGYKIVDFIETMTIIVFHKAINVVLWF